MKKIIKAAVCVALACVLVSALAGCANINSITTSVISSIKEKQDGTETTTAATQSSSAGSVIDEFVAGTYGGIDFESEADVVEYYVQCYNNTKAQTAEYIDADGNTQVFYALLGEEALSIDSVLIEGSSNSIIDTLVPTIMDTLFSKSTYGLPPCNNRNPELDVSDDGVYDFRTSYFTADDCEECNVCENSDGSITITIQPKSGSMSQRGADSQGRFFEVLGDIGATVDSIDQLSWASGTTEENCLVNYEGGTGSVVIDTATNTITSADYHMAVTVEVMHASVLVIKDKSASVEISYDMTYPASDEYLMESKGITRV
ncbi:MAG: hypothetical protein LUH82_06850 [Clostridiales bacterium]|nr:hypothetical protein [Clostridiales bacterium]